MADMRDFPALTRRLRYLQQEAYNYERLYLNGPDPTDPKAQADRERWARESTWIHDEMSELEFVLDFMQHRRMPMELTTRLAVVGALVISALVVVTTVLVTFWANH